MIECLLVFFMKKILIYFIELYQKCHFSRYKKCKYYPSCSNYMIGVINEFGILKGLFLGIFRIIKCNPFSNGGYDPIPINKKKRK